MTKIENFNLNACLRYVFLEKNLFKHGVTIR